MRFWLGFLGTALSALPIVAQPVEKPRVAVLDFQYATVMSGVAAVFGTNQDVGRGISDLVVDRLLKSGAYRVIERREIGKLMEEQNFSNSDRADTATAAKIGKLLGVECVITGDITQFGRDDRSTGVGSALSRWDKFGVGNIKVGKSKAVVAVTARLINVNTGEILASESGRGESARSGTNLLGGGGSGWTGGSGNLDMGSSNFAQTIIGEAVSGAVTELSGKLDTDSTRIPHQAIVISGLVADVTGNTIVINVGGKNGVHAGDHLMVSRVAKVIKDPATGKPLRTVNEPVGELAITSVDENSAVGTFAGGGKPKVGDSVKTQ